MATNTKYAWMGSTPIQTARRFGAAGYGLAGAQVGALVGGLKGAYDAEPGSRLGGATAGAAKGAVVGGGLGAGYGAYRYHRSYHTNPSFRQQFERAHHDATFKSRFSAPAAEDLRPLPKTHTSSGTPIYAPPGSRGLNPHRPTDLPNQPAPVASAPVASAPVQQRTVLSPDLADMQDNINAAMHEKNSMYDIKVHARNAVLAHYGLDKTAGARDALVNYLKGQNSAQMLRRTLGLVAGGIGGALGTVAGGIGGAYNAEPGQRFSGALSGAGKGLVAGTALGAGTGALMGHLAHRMT